MPFSRVKVVYAVYRGTREEVALALMGQKLKAALLLYGDNAASAITEENDDGDFLTELAEYLIRLSSWPRDPFPSLSYTPPPEPIARSRYPPSRPGSGAKAGVGPPSTRVCCGWRRESR